MLRLPEWFKVFVDANFANPVAFFGVSMTIFLAMIFLRENSGRNRRSPGSC
jgi:hypothetical protein